MKTILVTLIFVLGSLAWADPHRVDPRGIGPVIPAVPSAVPVVPIAPYGKMGNWDRDPLYIWCNNVLVILDRAALAAVEARNRGYNEQAVETLLAGLAEANGTNVYGIGPFTGRALARGVEIGVAMKDQLMGEPNGPMTLLHYFFTYYDFVRYVVNQLDIPYYVPYNMCGRCENYNPYRIADFERKFMEYTRSQLNMALEKLTFESSREGRTFVFPIGPPSGIAFLTAVGISAKYAAWDLRQSPYVAAYACSIENLEYVAGRIGGGSFWDPIQAVNESYILTKRAMEQMGGLGVGTWGCRMEGYPYPRMGYGPEGETRREEKQEHVIHEQREKIQKLEHELNEKREELNRMERRY